ncbi:MAG: AAA family ATPase, partial [Muribaculaceae bacterium]|nr:AAA family ATPase [Muribaculaceae bacterium]
TMRGKRGLPVAMQSPLRRKTLNLHKSEKMYIARGEERKEIFCHFNNLNLRNNLKIVTFASIKGNIMLTNLRLYNYKAFADTENISIRPLTLFFGKNNSGKSSILKALSFLREGLSKGRDSHLSLTPAAGISMGRTLLDLFHKRLLVELGFYAEFSDGLSYEVRMLGNQGEVHPYKAVLKEGETVIGEATASNEFAGLFPLDFEKVLAERVNFQVYHIGPLRESAPSIIPASSINNRSYVGYKGEYTYGILLNSHIKGTPLFSQVSDWFENNMEGLKLEIEAEGASGANYVLNIIKDGISINIADAGLGIAQVLPIIVQSYIKNLDTIITIEQPVLHLHPAAHAAVAVRLAESSLETGVRYVVETHSKNFLLAIRLETLLPDTKLKKEDVSIYYIDGESLPSQVREIKIRGNGSLSYWPTGIFGEDAELMDLIIDNG